MTMRWNEESGQYEYDGLTLDEMMSGANIGDTSSMQALGMIRDEEQDEEADKAVLESAQEGAAFQEKKNKNPLTQLDNFMGYVSPLPDKEYEKLSVGESFLDAGKALGTEAMHIFQPKSNETQYEARTHFGETMKYLYRYGAGMIGVGKIGAALKGVQALGKVGKFLNTAGKVITADYKFLEGTSKAAKAGKIALTGATEGFISDFFFSRPEEGEGLLGDLAPDSNNPIVQYFQTNEMDSGLEWRFKNAVQGLVIGTGLNFVGTGLLKAAGKAGDYFKSLKKVTNAVTDEEAEQAVKEFRANEAQLDNIVKGQQLIDTVQEALLKAGDIEDVERFILEQDFVTAGNRASVEDILSKLQKGQEIIANEDGSFSINVTKWQDAADVSMDELKAQTNNDGIALMDRAVKDTWTQRGWLAEGEDIVTKDVKTNKVTVNTKAVNRIKDNYINKFKIDNKINIEFVDGKINGADGTTQYLENQGKVVKSNKNAIDKKKLQIKELEDKITMAEGGNGEVSDPLSILKERLRIAQNELKELTTEPKKTGNIKILIDKNCENPYAVLRSELEHARDIAKGEVPTDKHFFRYDGANESEMSLNYVKKKADTRANQSGQTKDIEVKSSYEEGRNELRTPETDISGTERPINSNDRGSGSSRSNIRGSVLWTNKRGNGISKGEGLPTVTLEETTGQEAAQKFYNALKAAKEADPKKYASVDLKSIDEYSNMRLFLGEDGKYGFALNGDELVSLFVINSPKNTGRALIPLAIEAGAKKLDHFDTRLSKLYEEFGFKETNRVNWNEDYKPKDWDKEYYKNYNNGEPDVVYRELQSQPDTRPISERQQSIKSTQQADEILSEAITKDKPVIPWKVQADNADEVYARLADKGIYNVAGIKEAFAKGDVDYVNHVVEKQLAAERVIGELRAKLKTTPATDLKTINELMESIAYLTDVTTQLASAYGRGLNFQKLVGKARSIFRLSTMEELGLDKLAQLMEVDIKSLNFTRGIASAKQELYQKMMKYADGNYLREIFSDSSTQEAFDSYVDEMLKKQKEITADDIKAFLTDFANPIKAEDVKTVINACTDNEVVGKALNSIKSNGGIGSYIVHNLLSNIGTTVANVVSGGMNSLYFPLPKILGGFASGNKALQTEGWQQLKGLADTWMDSMELAIQAFRTGEGKLINLGRLRAADADTDKYIGLNAIKENCFIQGNSIFETLQNLHSFCTRLMGASDEFLTQMNYRSIVKAQAIAQAEELARALGKSDDMSFIEQEVKRQVQKSFNETGKPLNVNAYAEARDIVYQTPLSGKYYDYNTRSFVQTKEQTALMGLGEALSNAANKYDALKIIFPFIRTPLNIAQMGLEHNPIYALCSPAQRRILFGSDKKAQAQAWSKLGLGLMSTVGAGMLAMQGMITGSSPLDEKERAALFKTGWRPYSFKVGDTYFSYSKIEPLATIMGYGADMFTMLQSYDPEDNAADNFGRFANEGLKGIIGNVLDKASFMNGMEQFSAIYKLAKNQDNLPAEQVYRQLQMFLPMNAGVQALSTFGETEATQPKGLYQTLFNKYFNKGLGDYKRNLWGERQDIYNILISTGSKGLGDSAEDMELQRLAELGWKPTEITNNESGSTVKYKDFRNKETGRSFYDAMNEELTTITLNGLTLREAVAELINTEAYQTSPDGIDSRWTNEPDTKKNRIATVFNQYKKAARNRVIDEQGENFVNKEGLTAREQRLQDREAIEAERAEASYNNILNNIRSFS